MFYVNPWGKRWTKIDEYICQLGFELWTLVATFLRLLGVQVMFLRSQGDGHCSYPLSCPNGYHLKCHNIPCSDAKEGTLCNVPRNWQVDWQGMSDRILTVTNIQKDVQLTWNILKLIILLFSVRDPQKPSKTICIQLGVNWRKHLQLGTRIVMLCCFLKSNSCFARYRFLWNHFRL